MRLLWRHYSYLAFMRGVNPVAETCGALKERMTDPTEAELVKLQAWEDLALRTNITAFAKYLRQTELSAPPSGRRSFIVLF